MSGLPFYRVFWRSKTDKNLARAYPEARFRRPQIQDRRSKIADPKANVADPLEERDDSGFLGPTPRSKPQGLNFDVFVSGAQQLKQDLARATAETHVRRSQRSGVVGFSLEG